MSEITGIDVSDYQGDDVSSLLNGHDFAFVKVSEGEHTTDNDWSDQLGEARSAGVVIGVYHYGHCDEDVNANVSNFVNTYSGSIERGDLIALDWEDTGGVSDNAATAWKDAWISAVQEQFPSHLVGLYCDVAFWTGVDTSSNVGDYLWIADYGVSSPGIQATWTIWQYTDSPVDTSKATFGSRSDMQEWALSKDSGSTGGGDEGGTTTPTAFPGAGYFGPGQNNAYVTQLGTMLIERGASPFYSEGAGPAWSDVDGAAMAAFQSAQGWTGADANGIPGAQSWDMLVNGTGNDIPDPGNGTLPFPSGQWFTDAPDCWIVSAMGKRLVAVGCSCYSQGPGNQWTSSDACSYKLWQEALGYTGSAADGVPGAQSWAELNVPGA